MEGARGRDEPLDYAVFKYLPQNQSYELFLCNQGKTERLALSSLQLIVLQLPSAKDHFEKSREIFRLQLAERPRQARWFTKHTLVRFCCIVGASELLEHAIEIEREMSQLEESRRFHLALYSEGDRNRTFMESRDGNHMERLRPVGKSVGSNDTTKNELLRALDVRLATLRKELTSTLDQAVGGSCSFQELTNLLEFTQNFGSEILKNLFLKYFSLSQPNPSANLSDDSKQSTNSYMYGVHENQSTDNKSGLNVQTVDLSATISINEETSSANNASTANIAQADRKTPTDSEDSSDSSDEGLTRVERSRPMIRSASPRRSASPMRRIQIGRSGSRRSTALTIKSLGFFPARERIPTTNGEHENSSVDEETTETPKKTESSVRKFSVQDAISLFESKQRDSNPDLQKRRASSETGTVFINTKKSVLRRWSSGLHENSTDRIQGNTSEGACQRARETLPPNSGEGKSERISALSEVDSIAGISHTDSADDIVDDVPKESFNRNTVESVTTKVDKSFEHEPTPEEWNQQKEAELNQLLLKMMQTNTAACIDREGSNGENHVNKGLSSEQKDGFYEQYKEKRGIQGECALKRAEKDAKLKVMHADPERKKVTVPNNKSAGANLKQVGPSKRLVRCPSPSAPPKREVPKSAASKKAPPRTSPASTIPSSVSLLPSPRTSTTPTKRSTTPVSASTAPSHKKNQSLPYPIKTSPKFEAAQKQLPRKTKKIFQREAKTDVESKDDEKQTAVRKNNSGPRSRKAETSPADVRGKSPTKVSLSNKATKRSSVVPLETKAFLRKGSGFGPGVVPIAVKTKGMQLGDSCLAETKATQGADLDATNLMVEAPQLECGEVNQAKTNLSESRPCDNLQLKHEENSKVDKELTVELYTKADECVETGSAFHVETPVDVSQICASEDVADLIWVEMDQEEKPTVTEIAQLQTTIPDAPELPARSPCVRHSLSQMLQADNGESELSSEWGNAENPPALVYQKDSPKGFKRLLKFGRKSRGSESIATGWTGSPALSDNEDDNAELTATNARNIDASMRKSAPHMKGFGQHKHMLAESCDCSNSSKRSVECNTISELLAKHSSNDTVHSSQKLRQNQVSASSASTKGTRSFFSLSTFKSKGKDTKLR